MTVTQTISEVRRPHATLPRAGAVTLLAMLLAAAVWAVAAPFAGVDLVLGQGAGRQTVGLVEVLVVSGIAGVLGGLSRLLLARLARGVLAWNVLAAVVLLVSLAGPLGAATPSAWLVLTCLHLTVGLVVILGQRWATRPLPRAA